MKNLNVLAFAVEISLISLPTNKCTISNILKYERFLILTLWKVWGVTVWALGACVCASSCMTCRWLDRKCCWKSGSEGKWREQTIQLNTEPVWLNWPLHTCCCSSSSLVRVLSQFTHFHKRTSENTHKHDQY